MLLIGIFFVFIRFSSAEDEELRLRIPNRLQEFRTTSLNWIDLDLFAGEMRVTSEEHRVSHPRIPLRIVLDPGHGGHDLGARGYYGIQEKRLSLRIANLVKRRLTRLGEKRDQPIDVLLTRKTDDYLSLRDRVTLANDWNADLFVSIHANSSDAVKAHGFEVYFLSSSATDPAARRLAHVENEGEGTPIKADVLSILSDAQANYHINESSSFAESFFESLTRQPLFKSNARAVRQAPFSVLRGTMMPAILLEVGYVTNGEEAWNLTQGPFLNKLASAISRSIIEFADRQGLRPPITVPGPSRVEKKPEEGTRVGKWEPK